MKPALLVLTTISTILLLTNVVLFAVFSFNDLNEGLVFNTLGKLSRNNVIVVYITWIVVYVYQILWIFYALLYSIRLGSEDPVLVSPATLGLYVLAQLLQIVINTVFLMEVSFAFLTALALTLLISAIFSYRSLYVNRFLVAKQNLRSDDSLIRGLIQNGLELYMTWAALSAILNFGVLLINRTNPPLSPSIACALVIGTIYTLNFLYVMTDLTIFDMLSRYTLAPFFLRIWIFALLIPVTVNIGLLILEILALAFTIGALAAKFSIIALRRKTRPLIPAVTSANTHPVTSDNTHTVTSDNTRTVTSDNTRRGP